MNSGENFRDCKLRNGAITYTELFCFVRTQHKWKIMFSYILAEGWITYAYRGD